MIWQGGSRSKVSFSFGEVSYKGRSAVLTKAQSDILEALVEAIPEPLTAAELYLVRHKGPIYASDRSVVRNHIRAIRRKLDEAKVPIGIQGRKGFGYRVVLG